MPVGKACEVTQNRVATQNRVEVWQAVSRTKVSSS